MFKYVNKIIIAIVVIISICICTGCAQKEISSNHSESEVTTATQDTTAYTMVNTVYENFDKFSNDINNYEIIKDDNIPLSVEQLDDESFELLLSTYKGSIKRSSDLFRISYLAGLFGIGSLREVKVNGEEVYYCIYSNMADSKRQYLFIGYTGADFYTWSCEEDVCINKKTSDTSHEKNIYYKQVKECDKY